MKSVTHERTLVDAAARYKLHTGNPETTCTDALPRISTMSWIKMYQTASSSARKALALGDISAGLIVAVMLIPQGMAYAALVGVSPINGLYASICSLLVYPWFSTAPQLAVGPVAVVSLLANAAIAPLAEPGTAEFERLAMLLALLSGVIMLALGALKAGFMVNFLSHPVLKGFTSAAAIIIGSSQLGKLLGIKLPRSKYVAVTWYEAVSRSNDIHGLTVLLALGNFALFAVIMWMKRRALQKWPESSPANAMKRTLVSSVPTALIVVIVNLVLVVAFNLESEGIATVGDIPSGLPAAFEVFDNAGSSWWEDVQTLAIPALVMSLVGFMESISISKAMAMKYPSPAVPLQSNQELYAIGIANVVVSLFSGMPVAGGLSRTSVNGGAGARTPLSSLVSGLLLMVVILFATTLFEPLPDVTLAATIVVAVAKLLDATTPRILWRVSKPDLLVFVVSFVATLVTGIEEGILIACVLSIAIVVRQTTKPHWALLGHLPGTSMWRNVLRFDNAVPVPGVSVIRFDAQLYFANTNVFQQLVLDAATDVVQQPTPPYGMTISALASCASNNNASVGVAAAVGAASEETVQPNDSGVEHDVAQLAETKVSQPNGDGNGNGDGDGDASGDVDTGGDNESTQNADRECGQQGAGTHDSAGTTIVRMESGVQCTLFSPETRHLVIDMSVVSTVDYTALHMLLEMPATLHRAGLGAVKLWLVNVRGPVRDAIRRALVVHGSHTPGSGVLDRQGPATDPSTVATPSGQSRRAEDSNAPTTTAEQVVVNIVPVDTRAELDTRLMCLNSAEAVQYLLSCGKQRG